MTRGCGFGLMRLDAKSIERLWDQIHLGLNPALQLLSCVSLGKLLNFLKQHFFPQHQVERSKFPQGFTLGRRLREKHLP